MSELAIIRLLKNLMHLAKRKVAAEDRTLASPIENVLRLVVGKNRKSAKAERIVPRTSTAAGGLMPGIDISDSAAIQEMDDLEYVERMKHFN